MRPRSLAALHPDIAAYWIPDRNDRPPDDVAAQSHVMAWWRCPRCGEPYCATVCNRTRGKCTACPACSRAAGGALRSLRRHEAGLNLAVQYPDLAAELHGDPPADRTSPGSHAPRLWTCSRCSMMFRATPSSRVNQGRRAESRGCPGCWSRIRIERNRQRVQEMIDQQGSRSSRWTVEAVEDE